MCFKNVTQAFHIIKRWAVLVQSFFCKDEPSSGHHAPISQSCWCSCISPSTKCGHHGRYKNLDVRCSVQCTVLVWYTSSHKQAIWKGLHSACWSLDISSHTFGGSYLWFVFFFHPHTACKLWPPCGINAEQLARGHMAKVAAIFEACATHALGVSV